MPVHVDGDAVIHNWRSAREPETKPIVVITTIDDINLFNVSLRFLVARCNENQIRYFQFFSFAIIA